MSRPTNEPREAVMTPKQFRKWMAQHGLSYTTAGHALGLSRRQVAHFILGTKPITRLYWLATKGFTATTKRPG